MNPTHEVRRGDAWFGRTRLIVLAWTIAALSGAVHATVAAFEDLPLEAESYWYGVDESGGFASGDVFFGNNYNVEWGSWDGFAYSNLSDPNAAGWSVQFAAVPGKGQSGSTAYGVAYVGWEGPPTVVLPSSQTVAGIYVVNNDYAYNDMLAGSPYSKKFGGSTGDDEDWFKLTITGFDSNDVPTGQVDFYLADYRFADNDQDYIVTDWTFVDLTALGEVDVLQFALASSDTGAFGMNTPAYFCIDSLIAVASPQEPNAPGRPYASDPGINGYVDVLTGQHADPLDPNAIINPIFRGWADGVAEYTPADTAWTGPWDDPTLALGPATGENFDIVSLGELSVAELDAGADPGHITLTFGDPADPNDERKIRNHDGYDFTIFENAIISQITTPSGSVEGQLLAELGYVEVSSNGVDFARFPSVSLTEMPVGAYGTIDPGDIHNLAGKHPNANGICTGTPFDLDDLLDDPAVMAGLVDVTDIAFIRIVDIPGSGDYVDDAAAFVDPNTDPHWAVYAEVHPIFDQWPTYGSGGFDLEAVGILQPQRYDADINLDGVVNEADLEAMTGAFQSRFGQAAWIARCDLAEPTDLVIDANDLAAFASQWGQIESWRNVTIDEQDE